MMHQREDCMRNVGLYKGIKDSGTKQEMQRCVEKMKKKTAYF